MTLQEQALARYTGTLPPGLIGHCAEHIREYDLPVAEEAERLTVDLPHMRLELDIEPTGFALALQAADAPTLHRMRERLLMLLDHLLPGATGDVEWTGSVLRNTAPPSLHQATVRSVSRVAPSFLRVELACAGTLALATGEGLHFSLLLPPEGRAPVWPRLDGNGRTVWPEGEDSLHRAVYTFVSFDPAAGTFAFDVFEHEGGRTTDWAGSARPGDHVAVMGPGGGDFPVGDEVLIAGDETALPAIRRILEQSPSTRWGKVFLEVGRREDICDLLHPVGISVTWLVRSEGATLWDHLQDVQAPQGDSRLVWIAAEKRLVRQAKRRFRETLGIARHEGYFAIYWDA